MTRRTLRSGCSAVVLAFILANVPTSHWLAQQAIRCNALRLKAHISEPLMEMRLGTAEWAEPEEVADRHPFTSGSIWLGRSPTPEGSPIGYGDDRHLCLVSGSRGGKGTTVIVNNLALWPGSVVVVDPKGENATVTACHRGPGSARSKGMGQVVHVLDPFNAAVVPDELRSRFNPLDALDPSSPETVDEAGRIADAIVVMDLGGKDAFWDDSARSMLKGLILHVLTSEEFEGRRTLITVRDLITRGDAEKVQILLDAGEEEVPSAHAMLWQGVACNPSFGGILGQIGHSFVSMLASTPKNYDIVRQTADRHTDFLDSPGMRRCLVATDFALSDLKTTQQGVSIYLSLPQRYMSTHFRWLRMMIALTLTEMEATPGKPACGYPVLFCLDEFAGLRRLEIIENAVAQIAGYGVKLMFVLQSLEQLKATYGDKWETFLSNCGLKLFFGLEDYFSREYVSKFIGDTEVRRQSRSTSTATGTQIGTTHTTSYQKSVSVNEQTSYSTNTTSTRSKNWAKSGGKSWGSNRSWGLNDGSNWKPGWFFRSDVRHSYGYSGSLGSSSGKQQGWSTGVSISEARSTGRTIGRGTTTSESSGHSDAKTFSQSETITEGVSESVHQRRLISENEIGTLFTRITDKTHAAYPGFALAIVSGENPFFVRKSNYYEDGFFADKFDPHPDYSSIPSWSDHLISPDAALIGKVAPSIRQVDFTLHVIDGGHVQKGDPYLTIDCSAFQYADGTGHYILDVLPPLRLLPHIPSRMLKKGLQRLDSASQSALLCRTAYSQAQHSTLLP